MLPSGQSISFQRSARSTTYWTRTACSAHSIIFSALYDELQSLCTAGSCLVNYLLQVPGPPAAVLAEAPAACATGPAGFCCSSSMLLKDPECSIPQWHRSKLCDLVDLGCVTLQNCCLCECSNLLDSCRYNEYRCALTDCIAKVQDVLPGPGRKQCAYPERTLIDRLQLSERAHRQYC